MNRVTITIETTGTVVTVGDAPDDLRECLGGTSTTERISWVCPDHPALRKLWLDLRAVPGDPHRETCLAPDWGPWQVRWIDSNGAHRPALNRQGDAFTFATRADALRFEAERAPRVRQMQWTERGVAHVD